MRIIFKLSIFLFLFTSSLIFSDTVCTYEYFDQGHALNEHYMRNGYNAPAAIELDCGFNVFMKGTCLYWSASEHGLELGSTKKDDKTTFHDLHFDYQLGAKGTVGGRFPGDDWNFYFSYLFYRFKENSKHISDPNFFFYWANQLPENNDGDLIYKPENFSSRWKLKMDIMDSYFSRPFYLGLKLTAEPFIGARGGWISQKYNLPSTAPSQFPDELIHFANNNHSKSWLVGILGGVNTNWILIDFFRIYANFSAALMYQKFKVFNNQLITLQESSLFKHSLQNNINSITPNLDFSAGLGLGSYLFSKRIHIDLTVGYDFVIYWNQNVIAYTIQGLVNGGAGYAMNNLMIHGLSGSLQLNF
jgi:hypothetical protein